MPKKIAFATTTVCSDGSLEIKLMKQIWDGNVLEHQEPHRTIVEFDGDVDAQLDAVSEHLQEMGYPEVPQEVRHTIHALNDAAQADVGIMEVRQVKVRQKAAFVAEQKRQQKAAEEEAAKQERIAQAILEGEIERQQADG